MRKKNLLIKLNKLKLLKMLLRVEKNAEKYKIFRSNIKCLIAVSGGQDSICLGIFLRNFQRKFNIKIDIVYCHHAWQQDSFFNIIQITKYAVYTQTGIFVFINPKI